ncbi:UTP--glucose-1-phosphate uridylyltransferase [Akkermansiaceae bacterium]|nr:UTP--glucose-1-phosphate uridylyltransferase [Akkermansiaceae bacterium]
MNDFTPFKEKMEKIAVSNAAILSFQRNYEALAREETGIISEDSISPCDSIPMLSDVSTGDDEFDPALLSKTVVIKLNGGLGTSMGLQKSKTLLPVRDDSNFLDIIAKQIIYLRELAGSKVRFLLMNSFNTSESTLDYMETYEREGLSGAENIELMQNQIPKIDAETLAPAVYNENPALEWCPPGHGDIYPALAGSGWLDALIAGGTKYAFLSNSDNLGAVLDAGILRHFAESNAPFLMEVTRRTNADRKGGHLAVRKADQQLLLREVAQTAEEDLESFQDIDRHQFFNTNSLWIRLDLLKDLLEKEGGSIPLPMIKNKKTVNPRDKQSAAVFQLESAMGAAIELFEGAQAICVPRSRFAPVKTTSDLFALRSDAYAQTDDGKISLVASREGKPPVIDLSDEYKLVDSLEGLGMPSLIKAKKLTVRGPVRFTNSVTIRGNVTFVNESNETKWVAGGTYQDEEVIL